MMSPATPPQAPHDPARIRRVAPHDLAPILNLIRLVPEAPAWTIADFQKLVSAPQVTLHDAALTRTALVAEHDTELLGLAVVQILKLNPVTTEETATDPTSLASSTQVECELESILVHPQARRLGIGRQLLSTAIAACAEQHAGVLRLEVRAGNQPAIHMYQRTGFVVTGRRPHYYTHPEEDALLMKLDLALSRPLTP